MATPHFIARQLAHPKGFLGLIIGQLMNRHNAKMNAFAVRMLELKPSDRVLEIGFGGGVTLKPLLDGAAYVAGVDRSRDMVRRARRGAQIFVRATSKRCRLIPLRSERCAR